MLKLKRIVLFEVTAIALIVIFIAVLVEFTPYLTTDAQSSQIDVFQQKEYFRNTVTLASGQRTSAQFNYTTYDPAILVVDIEFANWEKSGYLSLYCNGILIVTFEATPNNPYVELTTITFSGFDIVKPPPPKLPTSFTLAYGNEVSLLSTEENGYQGTFSYQVNIRGSR